MDLYNYASGDPINFVDPLGWHSKKTFFDKAIEFGGKVSKTVVDFGHGVIGGLAEANGALHVGGDGNYYAGENDVKSAGAMVGNSIAFVQGLAEIKGGAALAGIGVVGSVGSGGTLAAPGGVAIAGGVAVAGHGAYVSGNAAGNFGQHWDNFWKSDGPDKVYRGGSDTDNNLTPRPQDVDGLSTALKPPPGKSQIIDPKKLDQLEAVVDGSNHASIRPKNKDKMQEWIDSKQSEKTHPFTQELKDAIIGIWKQK